MKPTILSGAQAGTGQTYQDPRDRIAARGVPTKPIPQAKPRPKKRETYIVEFKDGGSTYEVEWRGETAPTRQDLQNVLGRTRQAEGRVEGVYQDRGATVPVPQGNAPEPRNVATGIGPADPEGKRVSTEQVEREQIAGLPLKQLMTEYLKGPGGRTVSSQKRYRSITDEVQNRATSLGVNVGALAGRPGAFAGGHLAGATAGTVGQGADILQAVNTASAGGDLDVRDNLALITAAPQFGAAAGALGKAAIKGGSKLAQKATLAKVAKNAGKVQPADVDPIVSFIRGDMPVPRAGAPDMPTNPQNVGTSLLTPAERQAIYKFRDQPDVLQHFIETQTPNAADPKVAEMIRIAKETMGKDAFAKSRGQGDNLEDLLQQSIDMIKARQAGVGPVDAEIDAIRQRLKAKYAEPDPTSPVGDGVAVSEPVAPVAAPSKPKGFMGQTRAFMLGGQSGDRATMKFASEFQRDLYDARSQARGVGKDKSPDYTKLKDIARMRGITLNEAGDLASRVYDDVRSQMKGLGDGDHVDLLDNVSATPKSAEPVATPTTFTPRELSGYDAGTVPNLREGLKAAPEPVMKAPRHSVEAVFENADEYTDGVREQYGKVATHVIQRYGDTPKAAQALDYLISHDIDNVTQAKRILSHIEKAPEGIRLRSKYADEYRGGDGSEQWSWVANRNIDRVTGSEDTAFSKWSSELKRLERDAYAKIRESRTTSDQRAPTPVASPAKKAIPVKAQKPAPTKGTTIITGNDGADVLKSRHIDISDDAPSEPIKLEVKGAIEQSFPDLAAKYKTKAVAPEPTPVAKATASIIGRQPFPYGGLDSATGEPGVFEFRVRKLSEVERNKLQNDGFIQSEGRWYDSKSREGTRTLTGYEAAHSHVLERRRVVGGKPSQWELESVGTRNEIVPDAHNFEPTQDWVSSVVEDRTGRRAYSKQVDQLRQAVDNEKRSMEALNRDFQDARYRWNKAHPGATAEELDAATARIKKRLMPRRDEIAQRFKSAEEALSAFEASGYKPPSKLQGINAEIDALKAAQDAKNAKRPTPGKGGRSGAWQRVDAEDWELAGKLAVLYVKKGVATIEEFTTNLVNDLGDAIRPHIQELWDAHGPKPKKTPDPDFYTEGGGGGTGGTTPPTAQGGSGGAGDTPKKPKKPMTAMDYAKEASYIARGLKLGADVGALLRQGGEMLINDPIQWVRSTKNAFTKTDKAKLTKYYSEMEARTIHGKNMADVRKAAGLKTSHMDTEEAFASKMFDKVPGLNRLENFQKAFLDSGRIERFDSFYRKFPDATDKELRDYAKYLNSAMGKSNVSRVPEALEVVMTSPRWTASRWEMAGRLMRTPEKWVRGALGNKAAKQEARNLGRYAVAMYGMLKVAESQGAQIEFDPRSSDFLKMRMGEKVFDPTSGVAMPIRTALRMMLYARGEDAGFGSSAGIELAKTAINTANPVITTPWGLITGKNLTGFELDEEERGAMLMLPLIANGAMESWKKDGPIGAMIQTGTEIVGINSLRYPKKKPEWKPRSQAKGDTPMDTDRLRTGTKVQQLMDKIPL